MPQMDQLYLLLVMRFRIVWVPEGNGISFELSPPHELLHLRMI